MKKKAAILTWCDNNGVTNYGQILQCYAIQTLCRKLDLDTTIIRYRKKDKNDLFENGHLPNTLNRLYEKWYKINVVEGSNNKRVKKFRRFIMQNISLSVPCYTLKDIEDITEDCEILICGSDQIWNPLWFQPAFALAFGNSRQVRIAYAPSGVLYRDKDSDRKYKEIANYIERFDAVSVREKIGADILHGYSNKDIIDVLDPTLLLSAKEWDMVSSVRLIEDEYIFCYTLGGLRPHKIMLNYLMKIYNVKRVVYIPSNLSADNKYVDIRYERYANGGPSEFISLIKNAKFVCTDSYHGMIISLIYNKQFCIIERFERGGETIASEERQAYVLKKIGIGSRKVRCKKDIDELEQIDYGFVNARLDVQKNVSLAFLEDAVKLADDTEIKGRPVTVAALDKRMCCGCEACANICVKEAVKMTVDHEGFAYPKVDINLCVKCGLCVKACPIMSYKNPPLNNPGNVYAAWSKDESIHINSTSGGIFSELALYIMRSGGYVCAAVYNDEYMVEHYVSCEITDIDRLRQSKYVQSRIGLVYKEIGELLRGDKIVLFCGTPCECSALLTYLDTLGISGKGLYTVDFICRGANSPKVYKKFLDELEGRFDSRIKRVWFKNKVHDWNRFSTKIEFDNGEEYLEDRYHDVYIRGYIEKNLFMRTSCTRCMFKGADRKSDITLGDFWGVDMGDANQESDKGTSMIITHSSKGAKLLKSIQNRLFIEQKQLEDVISGNICLMNSADEGKSRKEFMKDIDRMSVIENIQRFL